MKSIKYKIYLGIRYKIYLGSGISYPLMIYDKHINTDTQFKYSMRIVPDHIHWHEQLWNLCDNHLTGNVNILHV